MTGAVRALARQYGPNEVMVSYTYTFSSSVSLYRVLGIRYMEGCTQLYMTAISWLRRQAPVESIFCCEKNFRTLVVRFTSLRLLLHGTALSGKYCGYLHSDIGSRACVAPL